MADPTPITLDHTVGEHQPHSKFPGLRYAEKPPYTESYTREGGEVRRTLYCNWSDAVIFPEAFIGDVEPGAGGGSLKRFLPHRLPDTTKLMHCVACDLTNAAGAFFKGGLKDIVFRDQINNLDGLAEWNVIYRQLPFDVKADDGGQTSELYRFVERNPKFGTEGYPVPAGTFKWLTPNSKGQQETFTETATIRRSLVEVKYIWHWVPEPLPKVLMAQGAGPGPDDGVVIGRNNHANFDPGNPIHSAGFPPGHMLCAEPEISERFYTPSGRPIRNISYSLSFRPDSTWNQYWKQSLGRFDTLQPKIEKARRPYEPGIFDELFAYKP